ncbi:MAG: hypothetical protein ACAH17_00915 [Candidatus Paceibacterota bacterium]
MNNFEEQFLNERLEELENAADQLQFMLENEDGTFYESQFMKDNLTKVLTESAAVRRRLAELKHE